MFAEQWFCVFAGVCLLMPCALVILWLQFTTCTCLYSWGNLCIWVLVYVKFCVSTNTYFSTFFCPLQYLLILAIRPWYFFLCIHWSIALLLHSARFSFQHAPQGMFRILRIRMSANSVSLNRSPLIQIGPYLWNIFLLVYIYVCIKLCVCTDAIMLTVPSQSCLENDRR